MNCARWREAISARLDGEMIEVDEVSLDAHIVNCPNCREFQAAAMLVNRRFRLSPAALVPDRTREIVGAMGAVAPAWKLDVVRALLVGLAAVEITVGVAAMTARGGGPVHLSRELGAFGIAIGIGLLLAALRPARVHGLLPVVASLAITSSLAAAVDIASGEVSLLAEAHHLGELMAVLVLWWLTHPAWPRRPRPMLSA